MEFEQIIKIIEAVSKSELTRFKYEEGGMKLQLSKEKEQAVMVSQEASVPSSVRSTKLQEETLLVSEEMEEAEGNCVRSPLVGMFYAAPAEDAKPFVKVGDHVTKGQTLAIVEAMKLMNEIESEYDGTVAEIFVQNGQPVEYGQPLFRIS